MMMDVYAQIAVKIIKGQENIIGPIAVEQAKQISHMKVDWDNKEVSISGNEAGAIDELIDKYKVLFGNISVEVSKQAAGSLTSQLPAGGMPKSLK
jgi:hypothetical protein